MSHHSSGPEAIRYTWNGQLHGVNASRSWVWEPKTNKVSYEGKDIVLVQDSSPNVDECTSTTAEMSPHYRPPSWTPENIMKASAGHPVRVQGHLFYDGSHTPCTVHSRPNPKRASLWEVHPVYSFDVCTQTTMADCQSNTAAWTPLEKVFASKPPQ